MPSWTGYSCGKCQKRMAWEGQDPYYGIGVPYMLCENCGSINDRSYNRNEWDLMKWPKKIPIYVTTIVGGLFLGGSSGLVGLYLAKDKAGWTLPVPDYLWMIGGAVIGISFFWRTQQRAIQESRNRLADEIYRKNLLRLGIATGSAAHLRGSPNERVFPTLRKMGNVAMWCAVVMAIFVSFAFAIEHFFPVG